MRVWDRSGHIPFAQRVITVLWLSFLMAAMATGIFFSAIDPLELKYCVSFPEISRSGAYTVGFFLFWMLTSISSLLAVFFTYPSKLDTQEQDSSKRF
ncbi:MAG: hypothetical protein GKR93_08620 [Gammaproteobacteria bacterium]|nr:hypothetical protein [Gammaproteobacteria bacterium]